jgi:histidine transport system substrate-binding protein
MKKALLTLSALALCMAAGSALAKEYKELRFGVDPSYAPFESKAADGSLVGFDIDLGNAICAELKVKCKWVESDFDGMIPGLKANKFDGVISSMTVTEARMKAIDFSNELFSGPTSLVFKMAPATPRLSRSRAKPWATSKAPSRKPMPRPYWIKPV